MPTQTLEYVGFWARLGATILDTLLFLAIIIPLMLMIYGESYYLSEQLFMGPADVLLNYVFPFVAVLWFWQAKQATPGKMAIQARIVDARTGEPASFGQYLGRYFAYILSAVPLCLGYLWIAFDSRKRAWHDMLAGTVVIRRSDGGDEPVAFESGEHAHS